MSSTFEKPVKVVKVNKKPRRRGRPAKGEKRDPVSLKRLDPFYFV